VAIDDTPYTGQDEINSCVFDATDFFKAAGQRLAVVGGPCLLGTGEMLIHVVHRDGNAFCFDFNTGNYSGNLRDEDALGPHIRENAGSVVKIFFENKKNALTLQDCEFLRMPMEFARLLDVPVVIPLPTRPI
jgi:hypothetical protein